MQPRTEVIRIKVTRSDGSILLSNNAQSIQVWTDSRHSANEVRNDFAAWFFLPIAMRTGKDLHVEGEGAEETAKNARRLSEIWESWLPHHFSSVNISFDTHSPSRPRKSEKSLCFYSGGIDSTHALLTRHRAGQRQSLLTVHGLEYKLEDESKFQAFKSKVSPFSSLVGTEHIFVRTDAYATYNKCRVNLPAAHFSHIFALAGSAFLYTENYGDIFIAADYRRDQQFITHPWGSNSATNVYFDDGCTRLVTLDDHLTRTEKMPLILSSKEALASVTFCTNNRSRPNNCGRCQKCTRTKLMFFVASGTVPEIFADPSIPSDWYSRFDLHKSYQRAFLLDIVTSAKRNSLFAHLPSADIVYAMLKKPNSASTRNDDVRRGFLDTLSHLMKRVR
ncbi:hypothetical protein [Dongia deserti]|uniref:hypothetical protein n=1 Tax=Dongia deserti TaxID=2268030 RepID=UPI0013C50C43|nr:hypothetical protein [Dongia deserti]